MEKKKKHVYNVRVHTPVYILEKMIYALKRIQIQRKTCIINISSYAYTDRDTSMDTHVNLGA